MDFNPLAAEGQLALRPRKTELSSRFSLEHSIFTGSSRIPALCPIYRLIEDSGAVPLKTGGRSRVNTIARRDS
jgi:hypothetical protein